jgi:hypothetical protein
VHKYMCTKRITCGKIESDHEKERGGTEGIRSLKTVAKGVGNFTKQKKLYLFANAS